MSELISAATASVFGESFDDVVLPHLDAAYRLARWLMRSDSDAEDVVQDASLRAFKYFRTFTGGDGRAWFLRIVRNTCADRLGHRRGELLEPFDEEEHWNPRVAPSPETLLLQVDDATSIARAMRTLPDHFHRLLVLRELEGLSYRELAEATGVPIGTVMSRLSRARDALRSALRTELNLAPPPATTVQHEQEVNAVLE
jgi:RNA polymerase sigma-70 factor, ECF subfamily